MITLEMFTKRFYLLGFDLTLDMEADEEHVSLSRQRIVRIEARFKTPPLNRLHPFYMLNFQDTSKLTTVGMLQ